MTLTPVQLTALKTDIASDSTLAAWAATGRMAEEIAYEYNKLAAPTWVVWRSSVNAAEWREAIIGGGGASQLDALTASKRDSLLWAVSETLNPANVNVRTALDDFCGSQNTLKAAVSAAQKRNANRAEKLFSTGTGSTASPATLTHEGPLTYQDIEAALQS